MNGQEAHQLQRMASPGEKGCNVVGVPNGVCNISFKKVEALRKCKKMLMLNS